VILGGSAQKVTFPLPPSVTATQSGGNRTLTRIFREEDLLSQCEAGSLWIFDRRFFIYPAGTHHIGTNGVMPSSTGVGGEHSFVTISAGGEF
jgi:hypothetical protein